MLYAQPVAKDLQLCDVPNLLIQKWPAPQFQITTCLHLEDMQDGDVAGMVSQCGHYTGLAVVKEGTNLYLQQRTGNWTKADEGLEGIIYHTAHTKDGYLVFLHTAVGDIAVCANEEWEGKVYVRPEAVQLYDLANELRIG